MQHMYAATSELKDRIGYRDLENTSEISDVDKIDRAPAITTIAGRSRNPAPDRLDPFDLDNKLSRRDARHSLCPSSKVC
jgi:hypothetical protein